MKLLQSFLLTPLFFASPLIGSQPEEKTPAENGMTTTIPAQDLASSMTSTNSGEEKNSQNASQHKSNSTIFTKFWYGASAAVGKTRNAIFLDLYASGTLEADLEQYEKIAGDRLRDATEERYRFRDPKDPVNQTKIYTIFSIAEELAKKTGKIYQIDQGLADTYNPLQEQALEYIINQHARTMQPALKKEQEDAIAAADAKYAEEMKKLCTIASKAAANKRTLTHQSLSNTSCQHEKPEHFIDTKTYEGYLKLVRDSLSQEKS